MYDTERYSVRIDVTVVGEDWDTEGRASIDIRMGSLKALPKIGTISESLLKAALEQHEIKEGLKAIENAVAETS